MDLIGSQLLVLGAIASAVLWKCGSEASSWLGSVAGEHFGTWRMVSELLLVGLLLLGCTE